MSIKRARRRGIRAWCIVYTDRPADIVRVVWKRPARNSLFWIVGDDDYSRMHFDVRRARVVFETSRRWRKP